MLQRHRPFSGPLQQKHGRAACCRPRQLRHGCSSRPAPGACRRRLAIVAVLDGWAQPAIVGSSDSAATAEKQQQQQQLQAPLQQPSSSAPASGSSQQQQLQQQLDAAAESGGSSSASSSSSSSTGIHAQEQQPEQQQQQQQQPSWESWCAHFEQQDLQGSRLDALAAPLAAAVAAENYAAAAAIKAEADELAAADAVAAVRAELAAALAQERYAAAAVLRDEGWALLEGWWACVSPQHPLGHLLRIHPE
uniref:UVR domain-containing protein n=1 Tax=Tetradesmus obliquus TaxID=3088 RepID=A0A383W5S8_TETOB